MESKIIALKRELMSRLIQEYGLKPKWIVVEQIKIKGIYTDWKDDDELYERALTFAQVNNLPFGYNEPIIEPKQEDLEYEEALVNVEKYEESIDFYNALQAEHDKCSKRLL